MRLFPSTFMAITCFLVLASTLFYWVSAFSTPYIKGSFYLHTWADDVKFGTFGWCALKNTVCLHHNVAYSWHPEIIDNNHLTGSLIIVAITAGLGSVAFLSLLHSMYDLISGGMSFFLTLFTAFLSTVSTLLVLICWGVAHHRFTENNLNPHYGPAFILVIVGWVLYLIAVPFALIGWMAIRRDRALVEQKTARRRWY